MNEQEKAEHNEKYRSKEEVQAPSEIEVVDATEVVISEVNLESMHIGDHDLTTMEMAKARMDICKVCPKFRFKAVCSDCGCFMPAKTLLKNAECPQNKW